jgi:Contractile injection system tube protein
LSVSPNTPKVLRGAIIGLDPYNPLASVIVFQYNPDTLSRTLTAVTGTQGSQHDRTQPLRLQGAPQEQISASIEIDATDQLEKGNALASSVGIYPELSALEMLIYPKSIAVIANTVLLAVGTTEVVAPEAPLTLFIWGVKRILPVRLSGFTITEEAYDVNLNPIRAKVALSMRVLSYNDLPLTNPGYALFLAHQVVKEAMATIASVNDISAVASGGASLA